MGIQVALVFFFPTDALYEIGVRRLVVRLSTVGFTVVSFVLKSPWLCRLGDASYVMCTALYMMVLYDRARMGPTMKTSDEISIICLFPAYSASQILCFVLFVVFELLRSQMLNPYLS